jgi:hypothetical protein
MTIGMRVSFWKSADGHRLGRQDACGARHGRGQFAFWEDEAAARLERDDRLDVRVLDRGQPAWAAALGMGEQDGRAVLANSAAIALEMTLASYGPVFGVTERKNWSSVSGLRSNWTLSK